MLINAGNLTSGSERVRFDMSVDQTAGADLAGETDTRVPLHYSSLENIAPFGPALAQEPIWPSDILPAGSNAQIYALLDAARLPFLVDMLSTSDAAYRCLFKGDAEAELADVAPWLVTLDPSLKFTRTLFTQSDATFHLWNQSPGVLIRSTAPFDSLWHWCRKLLWVQDDSGKRFLIRWWDPTCFEVTMPILKKLDAQLRRRDFEVEVIVPLAWTIKS